MAAGVGWAAVGDAAVWQAAMVADSLSRDCPGYDVWQAPGRHGPAFVARRDGDGPGPWVLVTSDPAELRAALAGGHG